MSIASVTMKKHRDRKIADGKCIYGGCKEPPDAGKSMCKVHRDRDAEYQRGRHLETRAQAIAAAFHLWLDSGSNPYGVSWEDAWEIWQAATTKPAKRRVLREALIAAAQGDRSSQGEQNDL